MQDSKSRSGADKCVSASSVSGGSKAVAFCDTNLNLKETIKIKGREIFPNFMGENMNRLDTIIKYVDANKVVADIGSDHGITAIKVYEEKKPKKVIATDISKDSLQKLIDKLEYSKYDIKTIVTDGIADIDEDMDIIIISGMGGYLIAKILDEGILQAKKSEKLILQPNNSQEYLRTWLHDNGFDIIDEDMCEDDNFIYNIIIAVPDEDGIAEKYENPDYYKYGKFNFEKKYLLFLKSLNKEKQHLSDIYDKIKDKDTDEAEMRKEELLKEIKNIEEILWKLEK
ncbi:tRNA (adenine(22)-N(1))-methyltransferase [Helcococcus kunzii]